MRKLQIYVNKYGPEAGRILYHTLQSQAAHAGVSARLRRKIDRLQNRPIGNEAAPFTSELPLFPEEQADAPLSSAVGPVG